MPKGCVTDITFVEIRSLLEGDGDGELLDNLDTFLGAAIVVGAIATGNPAPLALLEPKNELVNIGKKLMGKLTRSKPADFLGRYERLAAAHELLVYTAFFAAADEVFDLLRPIVRLSPEEKGVIVQQATDRRHGSPKQTEPAPSAPISPPATRLPHPSETFAKREADLEDLYGRLRSGLRRFIVGLSAFENAGEEVHARVLAALEELPAQAVRCYYAQYFALAADYPEFFTWIGLRERDLARASLQGISADLQAYVRAADERAVDLDIGLSQLAAAVSGLPAKARRDRVQRVVDGLSRTYTAAIDERIIDDRSSNEVAGIPLVYPRRAAAFVPQAFQTMRAIPAAGRATRLEDEWAWREIPTRSDLSEFLLSYPESPYSAETPLIVLGHPGSGKSLLSQMLAARIATPHFNPVRIELRNVDVEREFPGAA